MYASIWASSMQQELGRCSMQRCTQGAPGAGWAPRLGSWGSSQQTWQQHHCQPHSSAIPGKVSSMDPAMVASLKRGPGLLTPDEAGQCWVMMLYQLVSDRIRSADSSRGEAPAAITKQGLGIATGQVWSQIRKSARGSEPGWVSKTARHRNGCNARTSDVAMTGKGYNALGALARWFFCCTVSKASQMR